jgi:hypothetical protein
MRELTRLRDEVTVWEELSKRLADNLELAQMGDEELQPELELETEALSQRVADREFKALFSGEYDKENAFLSHPCRGRWHGSAGLGADVAAHVHPLGRIARSLW